MLGFQTRSNLSDAIQSVLDQAHSSLVAQLLNGAAETTVRVEVSRPSYPARTTRIAVTQIINVTDVDDES